MADVRLSGVHKYYGNVHAVRGVDLTINDGEFAVLVGPSGCGKSTLLRTIAGLEDPDRGTIAIGGAVVSLVPSPDGVGDKEFDEDDVETFRGDRNVIA